VKFDDEVRLLKSVGVGRRALPVALGVALVPLNESEAVTLVSAGSNVVVLDTNGSVTTPSLDILGNVAASATQAGGGTGSAVGTGVSPEVLADSPESVADGSVPSSPWSDESGVSSVPSSPSSDESGESPVLSSPSSVESGESPVSSSPLSDESEGSSGSSSPSEESDESVSESADGVAEIPVSVADTLASPSVADREVDELVGKDVSAEPVAETEKEKPADGVEKMTVPDAKLDTSVPFAREAESVELLVSELVLFVMGMVEDNGAIGREPTAAASRSVKEILAKSMVEGIRKCERVKVI